MAYANRIVPLVLFLFSVVIYNLLNCSNDGLHILVCHHRIKRDTHDSLVDGFCIRAEAFFVSSLLVEWEVVNRYVVNLTLYVLRAHGIEKLSSGAGELILIKANDIQMPCCIGLWDLFLHYDLWHVLEGFIVTVNDGLAAV